MSIPNTLTIFINTRIRGATQLRYKPYMTVPKEKGDKVYIDPLIKLNRSVVEYIPYGYPETELYTQFFNKNEFNSLIQRNLGVGSQYKRDLVTATKEQIIDKNIRLTLDTLFKSGTPFYIGSQQYTIYSYDWTDGDWEIQPVNSSRLQFRNIPGTGVMTSPYAPYINPYTYGTAGIPVASQINSYTYKKLSDIDPNARTGNVSATASKIGRAEILRGVRPATTGNVLPSGPAIPAPPTMVNTSSLPPQTPIHPVPPSPSPAAPLAKKPRATKATTPVLITPNSPLAQQFQNYYNEGYKKGFFKDPLNDGTMQNSINKWKIVKNRGLGDCFFESLRDLLNGYNQNTRMSKIIIKPYVDVSNLYTVKSLRVAIADYIGSPKGKSIYDDMIIAANAYPSTNQWSFMRNDNGSIRTQLEVSDAIKKCATPQERDPGEAGLTDPYKYYWGDAVAVNVSEIIFNIKLVIINTEGNQSIQKGSRVVYASDPSAGTNDSFGTVISIDSSTSSAIVQDDDYQVTTKNITDLSLDKRYTIYCQNSNKNMKNTTLFGFILYSGNNHYEALYQEERSDKYLFNSIPSYIIYMIFVNCYLTIGDPVSQGKSEYGQSALGIQLKNLMDIYNSKVKDPTSMKTAYAKMLYGGADDPTIPVAQAYPVLTPVATSITPIVATATPSATPQPVPIVATAQPSVTTGTPKYTPAPKTSSSSTKKSSSASSKKKTKKNVKFINNPNLIRSPFQKYISNKYITGYDSDLTYYIVIDLELYPGNSIPLEQKAALACQSRYEKIRQSYADMYGYIYQPNEYIPPLFARMKNGTGNKTRKNR